MTTKTKQPIEIVTSYPAMLRDLLKAAALVDEEHDVRIGYDGITLRGMDPSHEYMVDLFIPRTFFDRYQVDEDRLIRLNLKEILKLVFNRKNGKLKDSTLEITVEGEKIHFTGLGQLKGKKAAYVLEPEGEEIPIPKTYFKSEIRILAQTLKRIIGDCDLHEMVLVTVDTDNILFQNADGSGMLAENELDRHADDILGFHSDGQQVAAYKVEHLSTLMRAVKPLSELVTLELSHCMPIKMTVELPLDTRLVYHLAPVTDIDHIKDLIRGCYRVTDEVPEEVPEETPIEEPPVDYIDIYSALEDLGFFPYSGEDGDLYRKQGLAGWRVQVYWGAHVSIQKKGVYLPNRWATIRDFGIRNPDDSWTPEHAKALEAVKELIERGTLEDETPIEGPPVEELPEDFDDLSLSPEEKEALETMAENYETHVLGREDELTQAERERLINIDIIGEVFPEEKPPTIEDVKAIPEEAPKEDIQILDYQARCAAASAAVDEIYRQYAEAS